MDVFYYDVADIEENEIIPLGISQETNVRQIVFGCGSLVEAYGDGNVQIINRRPTELVGYRCENVVKDGDNVIWTVNGDDTAFSGRGHVQLRWYVNGALKESFMIQTYIRPSITSITDLPAEVKSALDLIMKYVEENTIDIDDLDERIANYFDEHPLPVDGLDTELKDIRVGADGTAYQSAGDAVRGQVSDLKSDLNNYNAYDKVRQFATFTSRTNNDITFTWNADNTVCTVSGGPAPGLASTYLWSDATSMPTGLEAGTTIKVLYSKTDTYPFLEFVFYDSERTKISSKLVSADTTVTIPNNTAGMIMRLRVTSGESVSGTCTAPVILNAYTNEELTESMDAANDILSLSVGRAFLAEGIINDSNPMTPPYDDANTLPVNTALVYGTGYVPSNAPDNFNGGTFLTFSGQDRGTKYGGTVQICVFKTGETFTRMRWGSTVDTYLSWREFAWESATADADMTSLATFYKIGVVGDSFSSGSITHPDKSFDRYIDLSWPQVLGRDIGATVTNYTWGGLNTKEWLEDSTHGLAKLLANDPEQVYFLALGINDYNDISNGDESLGTIADINEDYTQNPDTFYGNYGRIIGNIQEHAPNAIIIMLSILRPLATTKTMNTSIQEIATYFGVPYIYCDNDSFFTSAFYTGNMVNNHPVAVTYAGMAKAIRRLTESFMVNNPSYFREYYGLT